jgi:hypothetical protein
MPRRKDRVEHIHQQIRELDKDDQFCLLRDMLNEGGVFYDWYVKKEERELAHMTSVIDFYCDKIIDKAKKLAKHRKPVNQAKAAEVIRQRDELKLTFGQIALNLGFKSADAARVYYTRVKEKAERERAEREMRRKHAKDQVEALRKERMNRT